MRLHIERRVLGGFIVTGTVLLVLGVWSFLSTQRLIYTAQLLSHATRIISNAEQVAKTIIDIETGQRGYVITGKDEFLEPYYESSQSISKYLNTLDSLTTADPEQQHRVNVLRGQIQLKLAWAKTVIEARRENFEKARDLVSSAQGKQTTDSIRSIVKNIQQAERVIFQQRNTISRASLQQFQYSFIGLVLASTTIIVYLFYVINKMMKSKNEAEEKLKRTVEETRDLYDNAPCGYHSLDVNGLVIEMNRTELDWLGYSREEVVHKLTFFDLISEAGQPEFHRNFAIFKEQGYIDNLEFDFKRKDGSFFPVLVNSRAIKDYEGNYLKSRSTVFDNTTKKQAEQALQNALATVHDLYDTAPCGYLSVGQDIKFTNVNQTLLTWLGYTSEEVIGKLKFDDLLSPESRVAFLTGFEKDFEKYKTNGFVNDLEFDFQRKDGTTFPVIVNSIAMFNEAGEFIKSRSTVVDNTVQKRIKAKFIELLEAAPDATVIVDSEGVIQMINKQCKTIFGYKREELVGQNVEILMPVQFRTVHPKHRANFFASPTIRQMGEGIELLGLTKEGKEFPVEISLSPIETEEGLLVSASIRDITERKFNENTIRKLNQELEAFTYSVSHDLRAPLRSITGYAQILQEDSGHKLDEEGNRVLRVIMNNANRMGQLIDDLLDFSRLGRKELTRVNVNMDQLVREIVAELTAHKNGRQLNISIQSLTPSKGDSSMLRQVWVNLISNALKYSSQREIITIEIGCQPENGSTCYYVKDNGAGFDMRYIDKLFGVFQRLHKINEFEGTGVGLALVKTVITRHGGRVWAEGKINEGAKFYFELPNE